VAEPSSQSPEGKVGDRIILGGLIVGVASILVRLSGVVYRWVLLRAYGGGDEGRLFTDAHFYALGTVMVVFTIAQQSVAPAFLPVFMGELNKGDKKNAWRFASTVLAGVVFLALIAALAAVAFPNAWYGFAERLTGAPAPAAAEALLRAQVPLMAPAFIAIAASVVTYMILNGHKRFFWAQAAEGVMRLVTIVAIVYAMMTGMAGAQAAAAIGIGVSIGCFARLATHFVAMGRQAFAFRAPSFTSPATRRFVWLIAPLLAGIILAQVRDLVNNYAVLFHLEGLVTANGNGRTLFTAMANLVPWALGVAMFPYFCELVDRNDLARLGEILTRSGRVLALFFFAFAGAVAVMSKPFIYVIYGSTGRLDANDLMLAALANSCYIIVLPAYALEKLVMQGFFSNRKMVVPTVLGAVFSFLSIGISVFGIRVLGLTGAGALATVALGYTFARYLKMVTLVAALKRHVPMFPARESFVFFIKAVVVCAVAAGSAFGVRLLYESRYPLATVLGQGTRRMLMVVGAEIAIGGAVSIAAAIAAIKLLRMEELGWILEWIRKKRTRTTSGGSGGEGAEASDSCQSDSK
jgi:peptidoglycan biosynthesis protein MviN/MurJ (putative lipid II flippase)